MSELFTIETFRPLLGTTFTLAVDDRTEFDMTLTEVTSLGAAPEGGGREPFSLVFVASSGTLVPQRMYAVRHSALEPFDLFVVPLGPEASGMQYEAIFT